jgi:hypothetical protein
MTSISRAVLNNLGLLLGLWLLLTAPVHAQDALSLSVSPTLFEMSGSPGQEWSSDVRVINTNPFELRVYTDVVNFAPQGESGQGRFIPAFAEESLGSTFAEWISFENDEYVIPPEQTAQIQFTINVPEDAPPGGHFAAVLIGTRNDRDPDAELRVETSQVVSSLLFLRVDGDVIEDGSIREFRTTRSIHERPEVTFELRFENDGNVHLQPQGDIQIFNMWGQERGVIPINRRSLFGNVLPESIRKYTFTWTGEWSLADIGRYRAVATLAYGEEQRQFASAETSFWVIPWRALFVVLLSLVAFIWFVTWAIKLYVRRMLALAGVSPEIQALQKQRSHRSRQVSVTAPIEAGMLDLRSRLQGSNSLRGRITSVWSFIRSYQHFFLSVIVVIAFAYIAFLFIKSAAVDERGYEVTINGLDQDVTISSEEVRYEELRAGTPVNENVAVKEVPPLTIINRSGINGLAARTRLLLEQNGYQVGETSSDFGVDEDTTVIVYAPEYENEALAISQLLGGALLSAFGEAGGSDSPITVYLGQTTDAAVE